MKKHDATWGNIEQLVKKIKQECSDAEQFADDAVSSAQEASSRSNNAYKYGVELQELLKIRKEYEDQSYDREELISCVDNMQDSISDIANNIIKIKKGR